MASPTPEDVRMRADLAIGTIEEVVARVDEVIRDGAAGSTNDLVDLYRLLGRLGEAIGHIAMGLKLTERRLEESLAGPEEQSAPTPFQGRRPSPGLDDR